MSHIKSVKMILDAPTSARRCINGIQMHTLSGSLDPFAPHKVPTITWDLDPHVKMLRVLLLDLGAALR